MLRRSASTATTDQLESFYRELEGYSVAPLWTVQEEALVALFSFTDSPVLQIPGAAAGAEPSPGTPAVRVVGRRESWTTP